MAFWAGAPYLEGIPAGRAMSFHEPGPIKAVLGPTNTGKTHLAIERMQAHASGMIGLPLRLLAREVYDKCVKAKGVRAVALITGEEKITPDQARYFICTVEAMPLDRRVEFLAIDEIQLCADPDRGHVFTDRVLRARGTGETMWLGAGTMRPMLRKLVPEVELIQRERLSTLRYDGPRKLTKLAKRSAIVAFSSEEVYAIAELIRRQRGGAAVVMGALSPRTRNAQAALYQSGEVDFLVATDAIGMGLNLDVEHVAFAASAKFDGRRHRPLRADELAQIAGRAGRFRTDGSFGETGQCPTFDGETIARIEQNGFEDIEAVQWRNADLDFRSAKALLRTLELPPPGPGLMRVRGASDEDALRRLSREEDILDRLTGENAVRRLWDACLIPDFRKLTPDAHAALIGQIALHLLGPKGHLPQDWIARELASLDRSEGDLDTLQARLAHVRTWAYAANRPDWLEDAGHWRERARAIEERLSDILHTQLTQRFIDRRTSALVRGLRRDEILLPSLTANGEVSVEGHFIGRLDGLAFSPDPAASGPAGKAVREAALRALGPEVTRRLHAIAAQDAGALGIDPDGRVREGQIILARLNHEGSVLRPRITMIGGEAGDARALRQAQARLEARLEGWIAERLGPLAAWDHLLRAGSLSPAARGLLFRLLEERGALDVPQIAALLAQIGPPERALLGETGLRFGRFSLWAPALVRSAAAKLHVLLLLRHGQACFHPPRKALCAPLAPALAWRAYASAGFRPAGPLAVRIDKLEEFGARLAKAKGVEDAESLFAQVIGGQPVFLAPMLKALGYRQVHDGGGPRRWRLRPTKLPPRGPAPQSGDSPFGILAGLAPAKTKPSGGNP